MPIPTHMRPLPLLPQFNNRDAVGHPHPLADPIRGSMSPTSPNRQSQSHASPRNTNFEDNHNHHNHHQTPIEHPLPARPQDDHSQESDPILPPPSHQQHRQHHHVDLPQSPTSPRDGLHHNQYDRHSAIRNSAVHDHAHPYNTEQSLPAPPPKSPKSPTTLSKRLLTALASKPTISKTWEKKSYTDQLGSNAPLDDRFSRGDVNLQEYSSLKSRPISFYASPAEIAAFKPLPLVEGHFPHEHAHSTPPLPASPMRG
ncbi:uncharacterized protein IL334_001471 [Kwoniella shivajii]|uniref:Uncharacterized protein n=1 Tax=Kwoniella shivajii TaxID=564305 RepID=A0ABZ1CS02_9TREE|nr:hypothetical protein IL334_001471 [Kwoniella shivajii]